MQCDDIDLSGLTGKYSEFANAQTWKYAREAAKGNGKQNKGIRYHFHDDAFQDTCHYYDGMLGFVEFNEDYRDHINSPITKTRTFDIRVKSGGTAVTEEEVNVAKLDGGCCIAHMRTFTIEPQNKNIDIEIVTGRDYESDGLPILSLIQIKPSSERRLNAPCTEEETGQPLTG
jgi:hypothetical protein